MSNDVLDFRNAVLDMLKWAVQQGHITNEQEELLAVNIMQIGE